ncbi:F-box/LRR-repeat protein At4g14103-like isoform X2 [Rutidosis leptorrhynchoides]|uniref:F-box/LRR-repeat protein At4g14103-like isoform X2 n=1 Tax=Rutidosis leptorrhynchoides TaxID=125765 RepID=UPI003A9949C2
MRTPFFKFLMGTDYKIGNMKDNITESTDRISQLPEFIVHHILSFLDSPLHLVRMSVLSKNWSSLTSSFPILDFNISKFSTALHESKCPFHKNSGYIHDNFIKYVDYTTSRFCKQNVSARKLTLDTVLQEPAEIDTIRRCLDLILKQGVQEFVVNILGSPKHLPMFRLPNTLSSVCSSTLTSLYIRSCVLPCSFMVGDVKFKSLKVLSFHKVRIDEEVIKYLSTNCPLLKEFNVKDCYGFKRFCVHGHQNLEKVRIYYNRGVESIYIEAPNLHYLLLMDWEGKGRPSMNFGLCKKLTTLSYYEYPSPNGLAKFSSNFPFVENLFLKLANNCNNLKLSSTSLKTFVLHSRCDLDEIDIYTPNLTLFEYKGHPHIPNPSLRDLTHSKARMECSPTEDVNIVWFQKLRRFLGKQNGYKDLKLQLSTFTYNKLLQQEDRGDTNIQIVLSSSSKPKKQFRNLNSLITALARVQPGQIITFTKEEVVQEAG